MSPADVGGTYDQEARLQRRRRREFIRSHHPDAGGDPEAFRRGLRAWGHPTTGTPSIRVVAVRSQQPWRTTSLRPWLHRRQRRVAPRVR